MPPSFMKQWGNIARYPLRVTAKRASRAALNPLLLRAFAKGHYDLRDTLVVAGGPRSGTTWLAELVCAAVPRSAMLFEPLHVGNVPAAAVAGFQWRTYLEPGDGWPEGEAFLQRALEGRVINWHTTSHVALRRAIGVKRWVVKLIHGNLLLTWLADRFPIRPPALIIRHPCATVASRGGQGWKPLSHPPRIPEFLATHPQFLPVLDRLTDVVEYRAALWCIDYYVPLTSPRPYPFHLVTYEQLVRNGDETLGQLCDVWDIDMSATARKKLHVASQTTKKDGGIYAGTDPLAKWQTLLSTNQIDKIFRVVEAFGLDFYTDALEPDYTRLDSQVPLCRKTDESNSVPGEC